MFKGKNVDCDIDWEFGDVDLYPKSDGVENNPMFKHMDETVDEICKSLIEEPHKWIIKSTTFYKKGTDVEIQHEMVCLFKDPEITRIWTGHSYEVVFSVEQGKKIRKAFNFARDKQASCSQQKVKNLFK